MNDAEYEAAKARVQVYIDKWAHEIGIDWWKLTYVWEREPAREMPQGNAWDVVMSTSSTWMYRQATITVYLNALPEKDADLEHDLVHEYVHVLLGPEQHYIKAKHDEAEAATENVTMALLWAREAGRKYVPVEGEY